MSPGYLIVWFLTRNPEQNIETPSIGLDSSVGRTSARKIEVDGFNPTLVNLFFVQPLIISCLGNKERQASVVVGINPALVNFSLLNPNLISCLAYKKRRAFT